MLRNRILGTTIGLLAVCACSTDPEVDTSIKSTHSSLKAAKLSTPTVHALGASKIKAQNQANLSSHGIITGNNIGRITGTGSPGTTSGGTTAGGSTIGPGPTISTGTPGSSTARRGTYGGDSFVWSGPFGMTTCPILAPLSTGHFESTPIFDGSAGLVELARHCLFTWYSTAPGLPPDYQALNSELSSTYGGLPAPVLDSAVVVPLADTHPSFLQALVDQVTVQTSPAPARLPALGRVRVAIVDTAALPYDSLETDPDGSHSTDTYGHGRLMGRLVHKLACAADDASCPIDIANHLALPYIEARRPDYINGGFFGTRVQVARAIHRALADWGNAALAAGGAVPPLVINLSIGWDPMHENGSTTFGPSAMVYLALERAACLGVAVVAAAGNTAGDSRSGLMLPARWQNMPTPNAVRCSQQVAGLPSDGPGLTRPRAGATGRLLEAVGAVDVYDQPLATTRHDATPRFVAFGQAAVTSDPRTGFTDILGGSSVSTAVLSAAVASVWSVVPTQSPADVLQRVFDASVSLDRPVEPCDRAGCDQVRRVAVCDAARGAACEGPGCGSVATCSTVPAGEGTPSFASFAFSEADYPSLPATSCLVTDECDSPDGPGYGDAPWVGPQPNPQTCPYCFINVTWGRGFFTLPPTLRSATSMQLELGNGSRYQIGRAGAPLPESFSVSLSNTSGPRNARLVSVIGDGRVTETPLLVY